LEVEEEEETGDPYTVVLGTLLVNYVLTHSFINPATAKRLACEPDEIDVQLCVAIPIGSIYQTEAVVRDCPIAIHNKVFPADLVLLEIQGYNVILGWIG